MALGDRWMTAYVCITFGAHSSTITVTPKITAKRNGLSRAVAPARACGGDGQSARFGRTAGTMPACDVCDKAHRLSRQLDEHAAVQKWKYATPSTTLTAAQ